MKRLLLALLVAACAVFAGCAQLLPTEYTQMTEHTEQPAAPEELDALTTMGLPPIRFLVMPRVVAAALAMPVLTVCAELAGILGGAFVLRIMGVPLSVFCAHAVKMSSVFMLAFGLGKGALFGLLVGFIGCLAGMRTKNTADGVGVAATAAVVGGIVAIAVTDGLLAVICWVWGI